MADNLTEQDKQVLAQMQAKQLANQPKTKVVKPQTDNNDNDLAKELAVTKQKLREVSDKLANANNKIGDLSDRIKQLSDNNNAKLSQQAINDIITGNDTSHFYHEYDIPVPSHHNIKFRLIAHAPSFVEQLKINDKLNEITSGHADEYQNTINFALAYAYFSVIGDDVPEWFFDKDNLYRTDILTTCFADYYDWYNSFRNDYYQF